MSRISHRIVTTPLGRGVSLDDLRAPGHYDVLDPVGLPAGNYNIVLLGNANTALGRVQLRQIAYNLSTLDIHSRSFDGTTWDVAGFQPVGGGGGGGTSSPATPHTSGGVNGTGGTQGLMSAAFATKLSNLQVFNVRDYGGVGDNNPASGATNRAAFEAAVLAAEAVGGGVIYAPRGTYYINYGGAASVGGIRLRDNMTLAGDGMGATIIKAADIGNNDMAGLVRTQSGIENRNIIVRDLTIDGNKQGQTGWANIICFFAGVTPDNRVVMDRDIWCINVECKNGKNGTTGSSNLTRGYGFDPHEVVDRFVAINCIAHDNERDGFVLDGVLNFQVLGCKSWNNGRHGFNFITQSFNGEVVGCHAWDNATLGTGNNYAVQSDSHHISFTGCRSRGGAENGFRIRRGVAIRNTYCTISGCVIETAGKNGVQLTGGRYNVVQNNLFIANGTSADATYFDIALDEDNGDTGPFTGEENAYIHGNYCIAGDDVKTKAAIREDDAATMPPRYNVYSWNEALGHSQGKYLDLHSTSTVQDRGYINEYDATHHGVLVENVDNGPALRALETLVESKGGGVILLPPGIIKAGGTGTASQGVISLSANVSLRGRGMGVTVLEAIDPINASITGIVRTASGGTNRGNHISDLTISGPATVSGTGDVTCFYAGGTTDVGLVLNNVETILGNNGTGNAGYGARLTSSCTDALLLNYKSSQNERDGLYLDGATGTRVVSPRLDANGRHNLNLSGAVSSVIRDQVNTNATTNGVFVDSDSLNNLLAGGRVAGAGQDGIRITRGIGSVTPVSGTIVEGMLIENNQRDGISLASVHQCVLRGNVFRSNGLATTNTYADISLENDSNFAGTATEQTFITDNAFFVPGSGNIVGWNVRETGTDGTNNRIVNNVTVGTPATEPISLAAGSTTRVLHNDEYPTNMLTLVDSTDRTKKAVFKISPNTPGTTRTYTMPDKSGTVALTEDIVTAPRFGVRNVSFWNVRNHNTTTADVHGITLTAGATGANIITTATARNVGASGTKAGTVRRIGYVSGAAAGNGALLAPNSSNYVTRGSAAGVGGFRMSFVVAIATRTATSRGFFGLSTLSGNTADANSVANTAIENAVDIFGIGWDNGDANLSLYSNDNTGTASKVDLGASFSVADGRLLEVQIDCGPNASSINYVVREITSDLTLSNFIATDLPRNTVFLAPQFAINNGTDAVAVSFDLASLYLENAF